MANARVTRPLGRNSAFMADVHGAVAHKTAIKLDGVADQAVVEANRITAAELVNDRSPDRRKTGRHLLGSFNCRVVWDGVGFPVELSMGSTAEGKKLGAINYGSPPHTIEGNPLLVFPVAERFAGRTMRPQPVGVRPGRAKAYTRNKAGRATVATKVVNHPGNKPHFILERALERAVQGAYHVAVRLRKS